MSSGTEGNKHKKGYVPMCTSARKELNPSACTPALEEGPPDPLWGAPFYMSLDFSGFALMFAMGNSSWMPAQGGDAGAPRSRAQRVGGPRAACAPCQCPLHSETALTCGRRCPDHCPLPVGSSRELVATT